MDRVAADEVIRVVHALFVVARRLAVEAEGAKHRRRHRRARRCVEDLDRPRSPCKHEHLAGPIELGMAAGFRVADAVAAPALRKPPEHGLARNCDAAHAEHLPKREHGATRAAAIGSAYRRDVTERLQAALKCPHCGTARPRAGLRLHHEEALGFRPSRAE